MSHFIFGNKCSITFGTQDITSERYKMTTDFLQICDNPAKTLTRDCIFAMIAAVKKKVILCRTSF